MFMNIYSEMFLVLIAVNGVKCKMFMNIHSKNVAVLTGMNIVECSVAELELEPDPVEQQLFAGAGAKVFLARLRLQSRVCKFL
jgi:hypothetical protein